jgi:hypothetical protein
MKALQDIFLSPFFLLALILALLSAFFSQDVDKKQLIKNAISQNEPIFCDKKKVTNYTLKGDFVTDNDRKKTFNLESNECSL